MLTLLQSRAVKAETADVDASGNASQYFTGRVDEARLSNIVRSADWLKAEYNNQSSPATFYTIPASSSATASQLNWLVTDQLGTPRMIFDKTGSLDGTKRHDYLPFGEELLATQGGRTTAMGYASDSLRQKFTQKERDDETGLDYFLARYYSSTQGRFTSPDEFRGGPDELYYFVDDASANPTFFADLQQPQSLNKYQYSYNNPLRYVDPDGHDPAEPEPQKGSGTVVPVPAPVGPGGLPVPIPVAPIPPAAAEAILDFLKDLAKRNSLPLEPILDRPTIDPIPINPVAPVPLPTTTTTPQSPAQPVAPPPPIQAREHIKGKRKSTEQKHQEGTARKNRDYGREKADAVRRPPRRPPGGKTPKGGWPPKPKPPKPPELPKLPGA